MTSEPDITLNHFFIFNSTYAKEEGEEDKKILFYYPEKIDVDTKIRNIGLSEAIIKFTESFNPDRACDFCHTHKTRQIYYEAEPDFWMVMIVGVPYMWKLKDGTEYIEYQNEELSSTVCQAILKQAYTRFRLFMGSFAAILNDPNCGSVTLLKHKLDYFYSEYLLTLKLDRRDILDIFQGLKFLPLDKITFLRVQCFMNLIEATFPQIKYTAFLYNDQLVWSGLGPQDMQVIYNYLVNTLLPAHVGEELNARSSLPNSASPFTNSHVGKFVTGTSTISESMGITGSPIVFMKYATNSTALYFVVYTVSSATICLFIDSNTILFIDYLKNLNAFLGPHLTTLVSSVAEQCLKYIPDSGETISKYLYHNRSNLAYKSTIHRGDRLCLNFPMTLEILGIITNMNSDTDRLGEAGEIVIKTMSDFWIIGKLSNMRQFFVVMHKKNANIIEIDDELKTLCGRQLQSIFFHY